MSEIQTTTYTDPRRTLQKLCQELDRQLQYDDSTEGRLRQERDTFAEAWHNAISEVLQNIKGVRADYTFMRNALESAAAQGTVDTDRIIQAIKESTEQILQAIEQQPPRPVAAKRHWWSMGGTA